MTIKIEGKKYKINWKYLAKVAVVGAMALFLLWLFISLLDINMHNLPGDVYVEHTWNAFHVLGKVI